VSDVNTLKDLMLREKSWSWTLGLGFGIEKVLVCITTSLPNMGANQNSF